MLCVENAQVICINVLYVIAEYIDSGMDFFYNYMEEIYTAILGQLQYPE